MPISRESGLFAIDMKLLEFRVTGRKKLKRIRTSLDPIDNVKG